MKAAGGRAETRKRVRDMGDKINYSKKNRSKIPRTPVIVTEGYRKKKKWLTPGMMMAKRRPSSQARKVLTGIKGSSVLATADRTSGYGESSSGVIVQNSITPGCISKHTERNMVIFVIIIVEIRVVKLGIQAAAVVVDI